MGERLVHVRQLPTGLNRQRFEPGNAIEFGIEVFPASTHPDENHVEDPLLGLQLLHPSHKRRDADSPGDEEEGTMARQEEVSPHLTDSTVEGQRCVSEERFEAASGIRKPCGEGDTGLLVHDGGQGADAQHPSLSPAIPFAVWQVELHPLAGEEFHRPVEFESKFPDTWSELPLAHDCHPRRSPLSACGEERSGYQVAGNERQLGGGRQNHGSEREGKGKGHS